MTPQKAMLLPNVVVPVSLLDGKEKSDYSYVFVNPLGDLVWKVASENPRLDFIVAGNIAHSDDACIQVRNFEVHMDGHRVGSIGTTYTNYGRAFEIESDLIQANRIRRGGYKTQDDKKAAAAVKKTFVPKPMSKIVSEAHDAARVIVSNQSYRKSNLVASEQGQLHDAIARYVFEDSLDVFRDYLSTKYPAKLRNLDKLLNYKAEMITVDQIRSAFDGKQTYLVITDRSKYIVSKDDTVNVYDDTTLPEVLKCKLGMLKLVEPEQMVENIGCRASKDVFVLVDETVAP